MNTPHDRLRYILCPVMCWKPEDIPPRRLFTVAKVQTEDDRKARRLSVDIWPRLQRCMVIDEGLNAYVNEFTQKAWQRFNENCRAYLQFGQDEWRAQTILDQASGAIWNAVEGFPDPWN